MNSDASKAWEEFNAAQKLLADHIKHGVATMDEVVRVNKLHRAVVAAIDEQEQQASPDSIARLCADVLRHSAEDYVLHHDQASLMPGEDGYEELGARGRAAMQRAREAYDAMLRARPEGLEDVLAKIRTMIQFAVLDDCEGLSIHDVEVIARDINEIHVDQIIKARS